MFCCVRVCADNDDLDVTFLGSTPMATALARGVDIESFFYGHGPGSSQGLVVDGRVIETPFDLVGKRIACPFGSTAHYQMAFIIDLLKTLTGGIGLAEPLKNLAGDALMAAWEAGEIDGAFCWGPVYNAMRADANMKVLLTAEQIAGWDKPTFIPLVYRRNLLTSNSVVGPAVVRHIAAVFAVLQSSWINFDAVWSETGPTSLLASVTHFTQNNVSAANNEVSHGAMSEFTFVSPAEQLSSCDYMGAAGCVATERGIAMDTKSTAEWQQYYKFIVQIKPTGRWWAYLRTDADVADHFSAAYNGSVLASALADIDAGAISLTSLLARGAAAWPATDGALGQDSTCGNASAGIVRLGPGAGGGATGSFGDGAGARAGRSYSDGLACQWEVAAASASDVVSLTFSAFRVWSGDVVTVTGADGALVAQLSGFNRTWPPLVALGGLRVSFFTDARSESAYNLPVGDGFVAHFDAAAAGCVDCGGRGECDASSGVCACDVGYGGADCSHAFCLGTQTHAASAAGTFASGVGALNATHVYPNDADCTFVVEVPSGFAAGYVRFTLSYDLEHAYDYVEVISGYADAHARSWDLVMTRNVRIGLLTTSE